MDPHLTQDGVLFPEQDGIFIPSEFQITERLGFLVDTIFMNRIFNN
jgi:hypothetical protein